jgi:hypothetical protein
MVIHCSMPPIETKPASSMRLLASTRGSFVIAQPAAAVTVHSKIIAIARIENSP